MRVDTAGNATGAFSAPLPGSGTPTDPSGAVTVFKLASAGDRLIYATRMIPNLNYSQPVALAIDAAGIGLSRIRTGPPAFSETAPLLNGLGWLTPRSWHNAS